MKRFFTLIVIASMTVTLFAQKKSTKELNAEINYLTQKVDSLTRVCQQNNLQIQHLKKSLELYSSLESMQKSTHTDISTLVGRIDKLVGKVDELAETIAENGLNTGAPAPAPAPVQPQVPKYTVEGKLSCDRVLVKEGFLYGYASGNGKYVIPAQFEEAKDFVENTAKVRKNGKWGVINKEGKQTIPCTYDEVQQYYGSIWRVKKGNLYGLISGSTGTVIQNVKYSSIYELSQNRANMCINGKWGFFDEKGKIAIPAQYDNVSVFGDDGTCWVKKNGRYFYIDKNGNFVRY